MDETREAAYFGFTGPIEPAGVGRLAGALNSAVNSGVSLVHLAFSSNGGYVADGVYLYNHIRANVNHIRANVIGPPETWVKRYPCPR